MILKLSALLSILNIVDAWLTQVGLDRGIVYETNNMVLELHSQGLLLPVKVFFSVLVLGLGITFHYLKKSLNERKSVLVAEAVVAVVTTVVATAYAFAVLNNFIYLAHNFIWGSR